MAATFVRVKRSLEEEPLEALILKCKRRKINAKDEVENSGEEQLSTVLTFAGTVNKDENVLNHLNKHTIIPDLKDLKDHFKKHDVVNVNEKLREERKEISKINRYKVVNYFRSEHARKDNTTGGQSTDESGEVAVYDIEAFDFEKTEDEGQQISDDSKKFVYDLYYTNSDDFGELQVEEYISIHPLHDNLYFFNEDMAEDSEDDSEDSNAENFWKNDYPDEEDDLSITEDDLVKAVKNVDINNELSSDEEEEGFVYSIDSEAAGFEEDIDESDVHRYGERYARFKAKHKHVESPGVEKDLYYGDIDENEYYY